MFLELLTNFLIHIFEKNISVISKKLYPQETFEDDIEVRPRPESPVVLITFSKIPRIEIFLEIKNNSPFLDIIFDGGIFSLDIHSDTGYHYILRQESYNTKYYIKKRNKNKIPIYRYILLNQSQINCLNSIKESKELWAKIESTIYIRSDLYQFIEKKITIENISCKLQY